MYTSVHGEKCAAWFAPCVTLPPYCRRVLKRSRPVKNKNLPRVSETVRRPAARPRGHRRAARCHSFVAPKVRTGICSASRGAALV
jgi:hypothetical protein